MHLALGVRPSIIDRMDDRIDEAVRDAAARGLAGLYAPRRDVVRPFLAIRRAEVEHYAAARGVVWREDPTNDDPRFLRNRMRHELLPLLASARPALGDELLAVAA